MTRYNASAPSFIALAVVLGLASIIAVLLRLFARTRSKAHLGMDDVFAVVALCGFLTFLGLVLWESYNGLHYEFQLLPPEVLEKDLKGLYYSDILAPLPPAAGRFSLLLLYNRVFKSDSRFHVAVRILGLVNALWYVGCTLALILRCVPPRKVWDPLITGQCINAVAFVVAAEIPDSLLDFAVMMLPISVLRKLQMSVRHKINLAMIFAVGGFVGLIGFLRIAITYRPANASLYETDIWLCIQLGFSVICCCLPTYGPILPKDSIFVPARTLYSRLISKIRTSAASRTRSEQGSDLRKDSGLKYRSQGYNNLSDEGADGVILTHAAGESEPAEQHVAGRDFPMNAISIKSTVEMV